jgi:hypothetical protein
LPLPHAPNVLFGALVCSQSYHHYSHHNSLSVSIDPR